MNYPGKYGMDELLICRALYRQCIEQFSLHSNQQEFEL